MLAGFEGEILLHARAGEVNLLMGLEPGTPPRTADVLVDGTRVKTIVILIGTIVFNCGVARTPNTR